MTKRISTTLRHGLAVLVVMLLTGCSSTHKREIMDLIPQLDATLINYRSQTFELSEQLPLDTSVVAGELGSHAALVSPVIIPISFSGYEFVDIERARVYLKMHLEGGNHDGTTSMTLFIGNSIDIYNDPVAVQVQRKMFLPADFELSSEDARLRQIFALEQVVFGIRFVVEPTRLDSHSIHITGHIEKFEAELSGVQGVF